MARLPRRGPNGRFLPADWTGPYQIVDSLGRKRWFTSGGKPTTKSRSAGAFELARRARARRELAESTKRIRETEPTAPPLSEVQHFGFDTRLSTADPRRTYIYLADYVVTEAEYLGLTTGDIKTKTLGAFPGGADPETLAQLSLDLEDPGSDWTGSVWRTPNPID